VKTLLFDFDHITDPEVGLINPWQIFIKIVFPAPLGPRIIFGAPKKILVEMSFKIVLVPIA
jgi:hypothetical protein